MTETLAPAQVGTGDGYVPSALQVIPVRSAASRSRARASSRS